VTIHGSNTHGLRNTIALISVSITYHHGQVEIQPFLLGQFLWRVKHSGQSAWHSWTHVFPTLGVALHPSPSSSAPPPLPLPLPLLAHPPQGSLADDAVPLVARVAGAGAHAGTRHVAPGGAVALALILQQHGHHDNSSTPVSRRGATSRVRGSVTYPCARVCVCVPPGRGGGVRSYLETQVDVPTLLSVSSVASVTCAQRLVRGQVNTQTSHHSQEDND